MSLSCSKPLLRPLEEEKGEMVLDGSATLVETSSSHLSSLITNRYISFYARFINSIDLLVNTFILRDAKERAYLHIHKDEMSYSLYGPFSCVRREYLICLVSA